MNHNDQGRLTLPDYQAGPYNAHSDVRVLSIQIANLATTIGEMRADISKLSAEIVNVNNMANRWKGGFIVVMAVGAFIGWLISVGAGLTKIFGGNG